MADEQSRTCPECDGAMAPIQVHDKTHRTGHHQEVEYSLPGGRPSFWLGRYPAAGTVAAFMCGGCGRINLYGVPKDE